MYVDSWAHFTPSEWDGNRERMKKEGRRSESPPFLRRLYLEQELQAELQRSGPACARRMQEITSCRKVIVDVDAAGAASGPLRVVEDVERLRAELKPG